MIFGWHFYSPDGVACEHNRERMREKAVPFHGKMVFGCAAQQNERSISFIIDKFAIEIGICLFGLAMQTKNDVIHFNTRNSRLLDEKTNKSSNLRRQCYFRWRVRGRQEGWQIQINRNG